MQRTGAQLIEKQDNGLLSYMELLRYALTAGRTPGTIYASVLQFPKMVKFSLMQVCKMLKLGAGERK